MTRGKRPIVQSLKASMTLALVLGGVLATSAEPAAADLPPTAVAMGDSFISGEGAGGYTNVVDSSGISQGFPGWAAANANAFFCHRSENASIQVAALPGIVERFNVACSGAQPQDFDNPSSARQKGRQVASQLDQLRAISQDHDIDVVLIGLGSNNQYFNFGDVASRCISGFFGDAYTRRFLGSLTSVDRTPCSTLNLPPSDALSQAQQDTLTEIRKVAMLLQEVDADGIHQIVLQDYTNPLPFDFASNFYDERGRTDTSVVFQPLAVERYAGGCPVHRAALGPAIQLTTDLGNLVAKTRDQIKNEFPTLDITYLNVQSAFDGARLCEQADSPANTLVKPVRLQRNPNGYFHESIGSWNLLHFEEARSTCEGFYQTCQESLHPNAAGHEVLGQCLTNAVVSHSERVKCQRNPNTGELTMVELAPSIELRVTGETVRVGGAGVHGPAEAEAFINYDLVTTNFWPSISDVQVTAASDLPLDDPLYVGPTVPGTIQIQYPCRLGTPRITVTVTATVNGQPGQVFSGSYVAFTQEVCGSR